MIHNFDLAPHSKLMTFAVIAPFGPSANVFDNIQGFSSNYRPERWTFSSQKFSAQEDMNVTVINGIKLTSQPQDNLGTDHLDLRFLSWLAHQFNRQIRRTVNENQQESTKILIKSEVQLQTRLSCHVHFRKSARNLIQKYRNTEGQV